jgi:regulator of replication initiation timing
MVNKKSERIIKYHHYEHRDERLRDIKKSIEELKQKLDNLISDNNTTSVSNEILKVSQELDEQINLFMHIKNDKA